MQFDMNRTWSQAIAMVRANFQLLAVIAGVFVLLPALVVYSAMPEVFSMTAFTTDSKTIDAQMAAAFPQLLIYGLVALVLEMVGYMAMIALMGGGRPTVGESIVRGIKAIPTVLGAAVAIALAYMILGIVFALVMGLLMALTGSAGSLTAAGVIGIATYVVLLVASAYAFARLAPLLPVIVLEPQYNPLKALVRAWRLTAPRAWTILGFFALLFVAYLVISVVFMTLLSAFGVVAGGAPGGAGVFIMGLFAGLLGAAVAMLISGILVSIYQQLSGPSPAELSQTFE